MNPADKLTAARRHYDLAAAAHRSDKLAEAARHYGEVHKLFADHPGALHGLGLIALREHRYGDAAGFLRKAGRAAPHNEAIQTDLGQALLRLGRYKDALQTLRKVLETQPENIAALGFAGDALSILGNTDDAQTAFRKILALEPNNAAAQFGLGNVLIQLGRMEDGRTALERAIALAPKRATYHRALAELERFAEGDSRLPALESLARDEQGLPDDQKIELHFALAKAYDDLGRADAAFAHLETGNRIRRQMVAYDEAAVADLFAELKEAFTAERLRHAPGEASAAPIFVVGMPRSGTTLVEQILSSDPFVLGAGELTHVQELIAEGLSGEHYPSNIATLLDAALARFGKDYLRRLGKLPSGVRRVVDKFPGNFQHIGLIHLTLPNAKIIHVHRDPMDTCFSCYSKLFLNGLNYTYDLGELGRYYRLYESLMTHWRTVLPGGVMLDVQYETLVGDFENQARRIVQFCGLGWSERFLSFHENDRAVRTHSQAQVRQPLFASSIGRWRRYEPHLKPLRDALGHA
ncbi:MAG TPA: sulfotransferase [Rhizomicrobium sp.]|nr:sulfotransferase [Rhizomicrobium sp.]